MARARRAPATVPRPMARPVAEAPCRSAFGALRLRGRSPVPGAARPWSEPTGGVVISAPERAGQPEEVSGEGLDQPVGDERVEAPLTLDDVVGHALEVRARSESSGTRLVARVCSARVGEAAAYSSPVTARAITRRTLVSTTTVRSPNAKVATAAAV